MFNNDKIYISIMEYYVGKKWSNLKPNNVWNLKILVELL